MESTGLPVSEFSATVTVPIEMRVLITSVFGGLAALSLVAIGLRPAASSQGRTVILWSSGANPYRTEQIRIFNQMHPDILLKQDTSNNRFEKNIVQISSGVGPDLFDVHRSSFMQAYVEAGVAWNLDGVAAANGIAADADTWPAIRNLITYEGHQYGYPANVGSDKLFYNKNIFDRFGVPYPTGLLTWEEFFALLQRVSGVPPGGGPSIWGTAATNRVLGGATPFLWRKVFYSLRGEYFSADGTKPTVNTEEMRLAFQMHKDALYKYHIMPLSVEFDSMSGQGGWGGSITYFAEGIFATLVGQKSMLGGAATFVEQQKKELARWEALPSAQRTGSKPEVLRMGALAMPHFAGRPPSYEVGSQTVAINPNSPNHEAALTFLRFLASDTYARMVEIYGMPGNPQLVTYDHAISYPELVEREITQLEHDTLQHAYAVRQSPFLLMLDVDRLLNEQIIRLESDSSLEVSDLLAEAQRELETLLQLNLSRDPKLAALHRERRAHSQKTDSAQP